MSYFRRSFKPSDEKLRDNKENYIQEIDYRRKIDPTFRDSNGRTQLHLLLRNGVDSPEEAEQLINAGLDVNAQDLFDNYPVHVCAELGLAKVCKKLIFKNSLLDVFNKDGLTPLMVACLRNQPEVVTLLLQHGANPNIQNDGKRTAIHYAVQGRSKDCVKILIESRAKMNVKDKHGDSALILAAKYAAEDATRFLIAQRGINLNGCDVHGKTALHWAAENGSLPICRTLVNAGIDLDLLDHHMETAFLKALKKNKMEVMKYLLDQGCDRYSVDGLNGTPLALAALYGLDDGIKVLLDAGEDPDAYSFIGTTALMIAVFESQVSTVRILLEYGADPNARSRSGKPPIASCLLAWTPQNKYKRHEILKMLIRAGADVNAKMLSDGVTLPIFPQIIDTGKPRVNCNLYLGIMTGHVSNVLMLLLGGYHISREQFRQMETSAKNGCNGHDVSDFLNLLRAAISQPRSLRDLSRSTIRSALGSFPSQKIPKLPLANPLRQYINMEDLESVQLEESTKCRNLSDAAMTTITMTPCCSTTFKGTTLSRFIAPTMDCCKCEYCCQYRKSQNLPIPQLV